MALNTKLVTFSLSPDVIAKLADLTTALHLPNKSKIVSMLITERFQKIQEREEQ